ncbi:hypothetical protein Xvie_01350 [Xenorhabdus vietnamensis]|uniref:Calcium-dependent cell adhesion molecule 1 membrane-binding domain-containing protein n=1 Tax=Xenorhabdus vietnamensis TaxID=351656 RepID=A0A1Y2SGV1_9GAMM|nr:hypothetical protein [Xenorhabdus vietnamensis]OTA17095.1 hypothetical protein Xvie_01350 [Xenorhabdus vietnamensis]
MIERSDVAYYQQPNFSIDLNLIDTTDAKVGTYLMILDAEGMRNAKVPSVKAGSKMEYVNIPSTASSNVLSCGIYVRNRINSSYPLVGTIYLGYDPSSGCVDIATVKISPDSQLALDVDKVGSTKFDFRLKEK